MQALNKYLNGKNHNGLFKSSMRVWITVMHPLIDRIVSLDVGQTKPVDFFFQLEILVESAMKNMHEPNSIFI